MIDRPTTDASAGTGPTRAGERTDADAVVPGASSRFDRFLERVEALPSGYLVPYAVAFIVIGLLANAVLWVADPGSVGTFDLYRSSLGFYVVFPLASIHYLNDVARVQLATFRPVLDEGEARVSRFEAELTTLPERGTRFVVLGAIVFTIPFAAFTPAFTEAATDAPLVAVFDAVLYLAAFSAIGMLLYHSYRQLRTVSEIHETTVDIDLFRPGPLYAFSWLTARTGMALLILNAYSILTDPATFTNPVLLGLVVFAWILAGVAFALPLRGMHARLAAEKRRLLDGVNERLEATVRRVHERSADDAPAGIEQLAPTLTSLVTARDVVAGLPTWPWDSGAFVRFVTTALLPLAAALVSIASPLLP